MPGRLLTAGTAAVEETGRLLTTGVAVQNAPGMLVTKGETVPAGSILNW